MPRYRWGKLGRYGDLTGGSRARGRPPVDTSADDITPMCEGDDARSDSWMTERARYEVATTQGKAVRYRRWPMQSGRSVTKTAAGDHAATRNAGGARIGCPRVRISMMIIAAPQCGQRKVG
jgi:hypothetical protein